MTSTAPTDFDIRRIGGRIGAEITGVGLSGEIGEIGEIGEAIMKEIKGALLEHKALVFRDQLPRRLNRVTVAGDVLVYTPAGAS